MKLSPPAKLRLVWWGTYDLGKPRTRILLRGLSEIGVEVIECRTDIWGRVEDKSTITSWRTRLRFLGRWLLSYPGLLWRYLRLPKHDAVVVGYPGQLDALLIWPLTRLRRVPLILDVVQSLYATIVLIRNMVGRRHPLAVFLYAWEWLAFHAADKTVFVSEYSASFYGELFGLPKDKTGGVMIGVEPERFPPRQAGSTPQPDAPFTILFYGTFHKLHGVETIVEAAYLGRDLPLRWVLIGQGQETSAVRERCDRDPLDKLTWIRWVPYEQLIDWLRQADVALGLIGRPDQTGWAIPNKTFQILSSGTALISVDSPAVRELLDSDRPGIALIPPGDPKALLEAVEFMRRHRADLWKGGLHSDLAERFTPQALATSFLEILNDTAHAGPE